MKTSGKVALGGVFGSLALVCLLGTVFPYATFALPAAAGMLLVPVAIETGRRWGWLAFGAVAVLNLLLTPSMEAKVLFVAFLGYYPLLKLSIDPLPPVLAWPLKLLLFNATIVVAYWLMLHLFGLEDNSFELFGVNMPLLLLALANVTFVLYDLCLSRLWEWYMLAVHPRLARIFRI